MPTKTTNTKTTSTKTANTKTAVTNKYDYSRGRRKTAVASLRLYSGKGVSTVNGKPVEEVFPTVFLKKIILNPLNVLNKRDDYYFTAKTNGGGKVAQANSIAHALSRSLVENDPSYKIELKKFSLLTRDSRMVERKHTGRRKARKSEQYSKR